MAGIKTTNIDLKSKAVKETSQQNLKISALNIANRTLLLARSLSFSFFLYISLWKSMILQTGGLAFLSTCNMRKYSQNKCHDLWETDSNASEVIDRYDAMQQCIANYNS